MKTLHAYIEGNVQGVGFRNFVESQAKSYGLTGWVKNLPDGRVECYAQGEESKLNDLIENLKSGPSRADVNDVDDEWKDEERKHDDFSVVF